jgi:hypothetical protein
MNHSENINEIAKALALCQGEMSFASKDSLNPHFKSRYADLSAVWDAIREPLSKHGLSVTQIVDIADGKPILISMLMHASGQWIKSVIPVINANNTSQGQGSGLTYARRYALAALVGCVQDDDDGQESMPKNNVNKTKAVETPKEPVAHQATCITQEQVSIISNLIEKCDDSYVSKLSKHLLDKGFPSYAHIPQDMYAQIITGINKNIELVEKRRKENV